MTCIDIAACTVHPGREGVEAPVIYVIDSPEHPFDMTSFAQERVSTIVTVPVRQWNDALTPWPAAGLYRGEPDFGGHADVTLAKLTSDVLPAIEREARLSPTHRAICGYSLGGLFSLYALTHTDVFVACGCLSGSVWYEGWVEHLRALDIDLAGRYAFLSLGTKERRAARPLLKTVQDCMEACSGILREHGAEVEFCLGPGNHLQHIPERLGAGFDALDVFLSALPRR